jgi:gamma-glutamylcyclotransferase (GGCT)/AIG2-like uncharacterized protein YtfP
MAMAVANSNKFFSMYDDPEDEFYTRIDDQQPWSVGCQGAPWWIDAKMEDQWREFMDGLWEQSSCTPDAAALSHHDEQLVFVYGTLKRGFKAHDLLEDSQFVGRAWTKPAAFKLVQTEGGFPAAVMGANGPDYKVISGEVYLVPTIDIKYIDQFESNGTLFHRRRIGVDLEDGNSVLAWIYLGNEKTFSSVTRLCPTYTRKKNGVEYYTYTQNGKK